MVAQDVACKHLRKLVLLEQLLKQGVIRPGELEFLEAEGTARLGFVGSHNEAMGRMFVGEGTQLLEVVCTEYGPSFDEPQRGLLFLAGKLSVQPVVADHQKREAFPLEILADFEHSTLDKILCALAA